MAISLEPDSVWRQDPRARVGIRAAACEVRLTRFSSKRPGTSVGATVWVAEHELAWKGKTEIEKAVESAHAAAYAGKGAVGHVYWIVPEKAEKEWPDIRAKIKAALMIEK